jgi:diamine N-acetyltransferase
MVHLVDIDGGNWRAPLKVSKAQEVYVANSTTILARAYAYRDARSRAFLIYEDETPIGMVLYHDDESLDAYIFSEIFIDEQFQGKGYGRVATRLVLDNMKKTENITRSYFAILKETMLHKNYMKVLASLKQTVTMMRLLWSWDYEEQVRKMLRIFLTDDALSSKVPQGGSW